MMSLSEMGWTRRLENRYPGKLAAEKAPEYIYLTISGPAIPSWNVALLYAHVEDEIVFGAPDESLDDSIHFLPGWPME